MSYFSRHSSYHLSKKKKEERKKEIIQFKYAYDITVCAYETHKKSHEHLKDEYLEFLVIWSLFKICQVQMCNDIQKQIIQKVSNFFFSKISISLMYQTCAVN